ncbi:MAG: dockerin type I domain-containing protein [Clostridiales bacterium]|nr:dockerin type I domain-containing protein [Clostridiales bacterium]
MKRYLMIALSLILVMTYVVPVAADSESAVAYGAAGATLTGNGVYVEVDDSMSMTVFRVEADGSYTQMTQPIEALDGNGATGVSGAPWKNALPWSVGTGTTATSFHNASAKLLSAETGYVTTGTRSTGGSNVGNEVAIDDFVVIDRVNEENVKTYFGTGNRLTVTGKSATRELKRIMAIETTDRVPGVVSVTTSYINEGEAALNIARFVESNYKIYDPLPAGDYIANKREAGLWTQQGATLVWGADYVLPMFNTMGINTTTAMDSGNVGGGETNNPQLVSRNNWYWGENGGLPFNDYWGTNVGILIGSAMPYCVRSMEIPTRGSGITGQHDTAYTWVGFPGKSLAPGVETLIGTTIVGVHTGDNYAGSKQFEQAMSYISDLELNGIKLPSDWLASPSTADYPDYAWSNTWESWGGSESFNPIAAIRYTNNGIFQDLGIKYIILDAAWYPRGTSSGSGQPGGVAPTTAIAQKCGEGNYIAYWAKWRDVGEYFGMPLTASSTDAQVMAVVRRYNQFLHENGLKSAAWCMPMSFWQGSTLNAGGNQAGGFAATHPDYPITTNAAQFDPATGQLLPGSPTPTYRRQQGYYPQSGTAEICLGNPRVLNEYTDYFCKQMFDPVNGYGFDGLKIDTQWGTSQCFAIGHGHDGNPNAGYLNYPMFWKLIYDKAKAYLGEDPWIKHCQCGTMMNFFTQNGTNRPITGDPGGSNVRKARYSIRMWKGLYGDNATAVSDHVENFGSRCKSLMAAGYILESKFYNVNGTAPSATIMKYFPIAAQEGLSSGYYMDEYKFGFDYPEALAYDNPKMGVKYYSLFASSAPVASFSGGSRYVGGGETTMRYTGPAELRGLEPGFLYTVTDYADNTYEAVHQADANGVITMDVDFVETLPLKVIPLSTVYADVSADAESDIDKDVEFTVSVRNAEDLLNVALEFEIDGDLLAGKGLEGLNGFTPLNDIFWVYAGDNKWKGTVTLGLPSGSSTGLTSVAAVDIAKFIFAPKGVGDAAFTLTGFRAVGLDGTTVYLDAMVLGGAVTNIDQRVFSKYDLNRDNVVDALDLGIMLLYVGFNADAAGWDTQVKVNDSRGKPVTASMCDVNGDGRIDMLDLLDLFIHYTK